MKLTKTSDYQSTMLPVALPFDPLIEHQYPPFYSIATMFVYVCHMTYDVISFMTSLVMSFPVIFVG